MAEDRKDGQRADFAVPFAISGVFLDDPPSARQVGYGPCFAPCFPTCATAFQGAPYGVPSRQTPPRVATGRPKQVRGIIPREVGCVLLRRLVGRVLLVGFSLNIL